MTHQPMVCEIDSEDWLRLIVLSGAKGMALELLSYSRGFIDTGTEQLVIQIHADATRLLYRDGDLSPVALRVESLMYPLMKFRHGVAFHVDCGDLIGHA